MDLELDKGRSILVNRGKWLIRKVLSISSSPASMNFIPPDLSVWVGGFFKNIFKKIFFLKDFYTSIKNFMLTIT